MIINNILAHLEINRGVQVAVAFSDCFSLLVGMPEVLGSSSNWSIAFAIPGLVFNSCIKLTFTQYFG